MDRKRDAGAAQQRRARRRAAGQDEFRFTPFDLNASLTYGPKMLIIQSK
jgi:hypothetical protein